MPFSFRHADVSTWSEPREVLPTGTCVSQSVSSRSSRSLLPVIVLERTSLMEEEVAVDRERTDSRPLLLPTNFEISVSSIPTN
jgi:hypothetical protein